MKADTKVPAPASSAASSVAAPAASAAAIALALATVYVLWGSTYLAMRVAVASLPPLLMAGVRHSTAGVILYSFARARGAARPRPEHWRSAAIIGATLLVIGNGGVVWAEKRVPSGMAALLICSEPMWIVLMSWLRPGGRRPAGRVIAGLLIGLVGLVVLVRPAAGGFSVDPIGAVALLVASIGWAAGSLYVQRATLPDSPLLATSMQMLAGGGLLFVVSGLIGEPARFAPSQVTASSLLALGYLVVFGSLIGFTCYTWLLRSASPVLVSTYAYVNPIVAVLLGALILQEPVTSGTLTGAAIILGSVALITTATAGRGGRGHGEPRRRESGESKQDAAAAAA